MNVNVGVIDRVLRIISGLAIIGWGILTKNIWGAVGIIPLFTGSVQWCPVYQLFGIKTCRVKVK